MDSQGLKPDEHSETQKAKRSRAWVSYVGYFLALFLFVFVEATLHRGFRHPGSAMEENSPLGIYSLYMKLLRPNVLNAPIVVDLDIGIPDAAQRTCERIGRLAKVVRKFQEVTPRVIGIDMVLPDGCPEVDQFLTAVKDLTDKDLGANVVLATDLISWQDGNRTWRTRQRKLFRETFRYCPVTNVCKDQSTGLPFTMGVARTYADNRLLPMVFNFGGERFYSFPYQVAYAAGQVPTLETIADEDGELKEFASRYYARFAPQADFRRFSVDEIMDMPTARLANKVPSTELRNGVVIIGASDQDRHVMPTDEVVPGYILQANYVHALMQNGQRLRNSPVVDLILGLLLSIFMHFLFDIAAKNRSWCSRLARCIVVGAILSALIPVLVWFVARTLDFYVAPFTVYLEGFMLQIARKVVLEAGHA